MLRLIVPFFLGLLISTSAWGFCGTYVGQAGETLTNRTSQVVLRRQGEETTLTLANDFKGNASDFAMLVPVPQILNAGDVRVLSPEILGRVAGYSGPRLVAYTCDDFAFEGGSGGAGLGCADYSYNTWDTAASLGMDADTVEVESRFAVGEYEMVVLSAEESSDLMGWLQRNDFSVDGTAEELLQEYIDAGTFFLAARVSIQEQEEPAWLSPIQITYTSDALALPIRLGTANSPGEQDMVLYTLTDGHEGQVGIANYPETFLLDNECMFDDSGWDSFGDYYASRVSDAFSEHQSASWLVEFSWGASKCDPCPPGGPLDQQVAEELGYIGDVSGAWFTRIRMRYRPDQAHQDLALYKTGFTATSQARYIRHDTDLEHYFPVCGIGWAENPGSCFEEGDEVSVEPQGCSVPVGRRIHLALSSFLAGLVLLRRRRR